LSAAEGNFPNEDAKRVSRKKNGDKEKRQRRREKISKNASEVENTAHHKETNARPAEILPKNVHLPTTS